MSAFSFDLHVCSEHYLGLFVQDSDLTFFDGGVVD
jgi:hypothetical protein